jgi:hypothetical protein
MTKGPSFEVINIYNINAANEGPPRNKRVNSPVGMHPHPSARALKKRNPRSRKVFSFLNHIADDNNKGPSFEVISTTLMHINAANKGPPETKNKFSCWNASPSVHTRFMKKKVLQSKSVFFLFLFFCCFLLINHSADDNKALIEVINIYNINAANKGLPRNKKE